MEKNMKTYIVSYTSKKDIDSIFVTYWLVRASDTSDARRVMLNKLDGKMMKIVSVRLYNDLFDAYKALNHETFMKRYSK